MGELVQCPRCGRAGRAVGDETIRAILKPDQVARVLPVARRFCGTPGCPVLYYGAEGHVVEKDASTVRVGLKETDDPVPLCYCFGFTRALVQQEVATTGDSTIPDRIEVEIRAGRCDCERKNPSGTCCLGHVRRAVKEAKALHATNSHERSYWDRHARRYDRSMAILGRPMARVLSLVREAVSGEGEVLEVAAGTGLVTVAIASVARRVVATDYSEPMLDVLRRRLADEGLRNVECIARDLDALGFEPRFDAVVCANVLHLVEDVSRSLASVRGVLRPGGKLVVPTFVHDETLLSRAASRVLALTGFPGRRRLTTAALAAEVEAAGFAVQRRETIAGIIPIGFVSARLRPD